MSDMPHVVRARVASDHTVELTFSDGVSGSVDLSDDLEGPVFEPLKDPAYFAKMTLDEEAGTIVWPNGADIAPETLYDLARGKEPGTWWAETLKEIEAKRGSRRRAKSSA